MTSAPMAPVTSTLCYGVICELQVCGYSNLLYKRLEPGGAVIRTETLIFAVIVTPVHGGLGVVGFYRVQEFV